MKFLIALKKRVDILYPFFMILIVGCQTSGWETVERYSSNSTKTEHLYINKSDSSFLVKEYFESGRLKSTFEYQNGEINGYAVGFYENGVIANKIGFINGLMDGYELRFTNEGVLRAKFIYENGIRRDGSFFFDNGQPTADIVFDSLGRVKSGVYFFDDGGVRSEGSFNRNNDQLKEGFWRYFYPNGNLREVGNYVNGEKRGDWLMYDSIGNLDMTVPYH